MDGFVIAVSHPGKAKLSASFCVFGGALIDRVGTFRTEFHQGQSHPGDWQQTFGGVASNVARHLAVFGASVQFASVFAQDAAGESVRQRLTQDGLSIIPGSIIPDGATPTYTVMHDSGGNVIAGLADMALHQHMKASWAQKMAAAAEPSSHWVADTNLPAEALTLLTDLKQDKPLYVVAVSPAKMAAIAELLPKIDGLICNRQEAQALTGTAYADAQYAAAGLAQAGLQLSIVSDGANSSAFARRKADKSLQMVQQTPLPHIGSSSGSDRHAVRMTGAGDSFAAACLYALCTWPDTSAEDILSYGHAAARLAIAADDTCPALSWQSIVETAAER